VKQRRALDLRKLRFADLQRHGEVHRQVRHAARVVRRLVVAKTQDGKHRLETARRIQFELGKRLADLRLPLVELTVHHRQCPPRMMGNEGAPVGFKEALAWIRLCQVVNHARFQASDRGVELVYAGRHHDGGVRREFLQVLGEPQAVFARKAKVAERDSGRFVRRCERQRFFRGFGLDDGQAFGFEPAPKDKPDRLLVVNDQYAHQLPSPEEATTAATSSRVVGSPSRSKGESTSPSGPALSTTVSK
jgi:hypothetical protein